MLGAVRMARDMLIEPVYDARVGVVVGRSKREAIANATDARRHLPFCLRVQPPSSWIFFFRQVGHRRGAARAETSVAARLARPVGLWRL